MAKEGVVGKRGVAGGRGFGDRGTSFAGVVRSLRSRPLTSHKGSVAGFTGYRLCRRPPLFWLFCVVLCCRRDGLESICMNNGTNGNKGTRRNNGIQRNNGTKGTARPTGTMESPELNGTQRKRNPMEPRHQTEPNHATKTQLISKLTGYRLS